MENIKSPLYFAGGVPGADHIAVVNEIVHEGAVFAVFTGTLLAYENGNIQAIVKKHLTPMNNQKDGNVIIVNNIQIDINTNSLLEFWNNWWGSLIYRHNNYRVVAEIASIPLPKLNAFIKGDKVFTAETIAATPTEKAKVTVFKGIVHRINGNLITVASSRTADAKRGNTVIFYNRENIQVGSGVITMQMHTSVTVQLNKGSVLPGFTARIDK
jgi:hypothetical protein